MRYLWTFPLDIFTFIIGRASPIHFIKLTAIFILVQWFLFQLSPPIQACGAGSAESADSKLLIARAEVIVRAVAVNYAEPRAARDSSESSRGPREIIEFKVEEVLKGSYVPATLHINGWLSDKDDFNDPRMTFDSIRPDGLGGSCHAYNYKQGGEFLLFLKRRDDQLTAYWASMAPSNQQLRPSEDPWLEWVKRQLTAPHIPNYGSPP